MKRRIIEGFKQRSKGKNPGDTIKIGMHHSSSLTKGRATHYEGQIVESHPLSSNPGDFWSINTKPFKGAHFAVFPPDIALQPILSSCPPNGVVLDPMCGSGTVPYVCELINQRMWNKFRTPVNNITKKTPWSLKWIGIDINPQYCEMAQERIRSLTIENPGRSR